MKIYIKLINFDREIPIRLSLEKENTTEMVNPIFIVCITHLVANKMIILAKKKMKNLFDESYR